MNLTHGLLLDLLLSFSSLIDGHLTTERLNELLALDCNQPLVTLHVFATKLNPVWTMNITQIASVKSIARDILKDYGKSRSLVNSTTRIMGYQGFTVSCSMDNEILIHGAVRLENQLLNSGRPYLSPMIVRHVSEHIGQSIFRPTYKSLSHINCDHVPIKGPDNVPVYNPQTDNGGCFIKRQAKNNCYAYGNKKRRLFSQST